MLNVSNSLKTFTLQHSDHILLISFSFDFDHNILIVLINQCLSNTYVLMADKHCGWKAACFMAIVLALAAVGISGYTMWYTRYELNDRVDSTNERLEALEKRMSNLTNRSEIERTVTKSTISALTGETQTLKNDYMKVLSETRAMNKTINYTTSATVQQALNELNNVKETQKDILKRLQALSHLNDTAEDHLSLREEIRNLTTQVNQNITHVEEKLKDNRREWQEALENKTSEISLDISDIGKRLDEFENAQNKTNTATNECEVLGPRKISYLIFLATLSVIVLV